MKKASIILILIMFFLFWFYQTQKSADFQVLEINSPNEIVIDLNKNGVEDENEIITLESIESFSTKLSKEQSELAKRIKITEDNALGLGFLAQNFAKETLDGQKVKLKDSDNYLHSTCNNHVVLNLFQHRKVVRFCDPETISGRREIIINNKNYKNLLVDRGFAIEKDKSPTNQFLQNLEKVRKLKLIIFNNKSHKYHKLNCKYGLIAHNSQILPAFQLPQDAKPCKFCLVKHNKNDKYKTHKKYQKNLNQYNDEIPDIKSPATVLKTDSLEIFLTDMTKVLKPTNSCNTAVCKALVSEIKSAQNSIDFAIYGYTKVPAIQQALENAQRRGVRVRFVYDLDNKNENIYPDTLYLSKIFTNNQSDNAQPIMHDKFFVFDNKTVLTGSANISNTDMSGFNSNAVIIINSEKIANIYSQEFEQMFCGNFHKQKSKIENKTETLDNSDLSIYFSPKDRAITNIIPLIDNAQKYIYIPAFLITHKELTNSLINASKRGVAVKIILDATNTHSGSHSKMKELRDGGIQVKTENWAGKLHSKSIIIDDLYTIIGSMNFSKSGENLNDENLIVIKNPNITIFYKTFFQYLWKRIPDKWLKYNARSESPDSIGSCSDGIDNDFDEKTDNADDSCKVEYREAKTHR